MLTQEEYEQKRNARYQRLLNAAAKAAQESASLTQQASDMASIIPMGQPILVGHHSESRDRNYRNRIDNKFRKGYELAKRAEELKSRAASIASNNAIYSDDPTAVTQLKEKIAALEAKQEHMKATNKAVKQGNRAALVSLGHAPSLIDQWLDPAPMPWPGKGYAAFELTNNSATIRATKARLEKVEKQQATPDKDEMIGEIKIEWRASENRIRILYPGRVDTATFKALRAAGYRAMQTPGHFSAYYNYRAGQYVATLRQTQNK